MGEARTIANTAPPNWNAWNAITTSRTDCCSDVLLFGDDFACSTVTIFSVALYVAGSKRASKKVKRPSCIRIVSHQRRNSKMHHPETFLMVDGKTISLRVLGIRTQPRIISRSTHSDHTFSKSTDQNGNWTTQNQDPLKAGRDGSSILVPVATRWKPSALCLPLLRAHSKPLAPARRLNYFASRLLLSSRSTKSNDKNIFCSVGDC